MGGKIFLKSTIYSISNKTGIRFIISRMHSTQDAGIHYLKPVPLKTMPASDIASSIQCMCLKMNLYPEGVGSEMPISH